ncbi:MAG: S-layer homology domain-containing protein, partial [Armatimonadetes bacterium]|nr:S-layer homology domain-containing protein [Armatimonadota bacterium]MDW8154593.1 S-layer homology domain-containing protein [Armatimonadota bacterium]
MGLLLAGVGGERLRAQPFADVPTNHWAYDAIAELAAKGLI